jgi:hypothetical protein
LLTEQVIGVIWTPSFLLCLRNTNYFHSTASWDYLNPSASTIFKKITNSFVKQSHNIIWDIQHSSVFTTRWLTNKNYLWTTTNFATHQFFCMICSSPTALTKEISIPKSRVHMIIIFEKKIKNFVSHYV